MECHKTKDIIHVKNMLGHRNINSTLIYINIEQAVFQQTDEQYTSKVAHNEKEILELIDAGWELVTEYNGNKIFRTRK